jgi:hypothetical protein
MWVRPWLRDPIDADDCDPTVGAIDGGRHTPHELRPFRRPSRLLQHGRDRRCRRRRCLEGVAGRRTRRPDAPRRCAGGFGDPPGFRVGDCATQRNLSDKGRADAAKIGVRLKREGIAFEKILSSPWCRCIDTANLLNLGTAETEATFGNVVVLRDQRETLTAGGHALIAQWTARGNLLVVTHGANILALTGVSPASGEIVVVKGGSNLAEPVGRLRLD